MIEYQYRQLFECNPQPMWVYDQTTLEFLAVNASAVKQYGYSEQEFLDMTIVDIRPPEDRSRLLESLKRVKPDLESADSWRHLRKNGELIDVEITAHKLNFAGRSAELVMANDITSRKKAECALRESEARFRAIVQRAPLGIAEGEFVGNSFISVNQRYADIVGYSITELMEMKFTDFTHPDDLTKDIKEMQRLAAGEISSFAMEKRYVRKDGATIWVNLSVSGLGPVGAKPTNCMAVIDDITLRKETEAALTQSEHRYRTIVEYEPECVKVVNTRGDLLEMNPAGLDMLQARSIEEVQTHGLHNFILPEFQSAFAKLHQSAISGQTGLLEFEVIGLKGIPRWLETHAAPLPDADGHITKMLGITRDITERKLAARAIKENEDRLSFLLHNTPAVIYTCHAIGVFGVTYITDNVQLLLGYHPQEFLEDSDFWLERIHQDDVKRVLSDMMRLHVQGQKSHDYRFRHADGTYRWIHDASRLLRDASGSPTEVIGSWSDISALRQAETEVRQLNIELEQRVLKRTAQLEIANKELESFSYSVSHDLRAPLRGIDGFARMLEEDYGDKLDAEGCRLIGVIRSESKRMGRLIDDLLEFSRMGRKHFENTLVDMAGLAQTAYEGIISNFPETAVRFELSPLPSSLGDPALLRQVFLNLIGNAVKFSRNQAVPIIEIGFAKADTMTTYFVKDNGVGFDEKYSHKLFGVFQRLHAQEEFEGTGIGLALVQRIVQRHGGKVWAAGKLNAGATIYFTLPNVEA